jgi:hypothetical protein
MARASDHLVYEDIYRSARSQWLAQKGFSVGIALSDDKVTTGDPAGTVVGTLTAPEGFALSIVSGPGEIVGANELALTAQAGAVGTKQTIRVRALRAVPFFEYLQDFEITAEPVVPVLQALTLSAAAFASTAQPGALIGAIQGLTAGSTVEVFPNDGRVAISGANLLVGLSAASVGTFSITLRETLGGASNSPRSTTVTITVSAQPSVPFTQVNGPNDGPAPLFYEGWSVTSDAPIADDTTFAVQRSGFTTAGIPTTYEDTLAVTRQVRQRWPNHLSAEANLYAITDYLYASDAIFGGENRSSFVSPKPIANWAMIDRQLVANTVRLEVVAAHRNARQNSEVACVVFTVSDGTNTVSQTVSATTVSGRASDRNPVLVYAANIDVSGLANDVLLTCNAKVYPWIGAEASVLDSAAQSAEREFSPRYFYRSTSLHAAPRQAVVETAANGGNDTTGLVSTSYASAAATPFATILAAINALHTAGGLDGAIIYVGDSQGTAFSLGSPSAVRTQNHTCLTITRKPGVSREAAHIKGAISTRFQWLRLHDVKYERDVTSLWAGQGFTLRVFWDDVDFVGTVNGALGGTTVKQYIYGMNITGLASHLTPGNTETRMVRGLNVLSGGGQVECFLALGCHAPGVSWSRGARSVNGMIHAYNTGAAGMPNAGDGEDITMGVAYLQNVTEWTSATTGISGSVSADNQSGNTAHIVMHGNTHAGAADAGRHNIFYDEGTTPRFHKLMSVVGNLTAEINSKSDIFRAVNQANPEGFTAGSPSTRIGNWAFMYGVGCRGNWSQHAPANAGSEGQVYAGPGSSINPARTPALMATSNFVLYRAATTANASTYTAGAGGGNYRLASAAAPVIGIVPDPVLSHDLNGNPRPASNDTAGAYCYVA